MWYKHLLGTMPDRDLAEMIGVNVIAVRNARCCRGIPCVRAGVWKRPPLDVRFWAKVDKSGDCWLWTASTDTRGYGKIGDNGRTLVATRVSWFLEHGEWPTLFVCHHCDNPRCVRPSHLFEGTARDNAQDCKRKGRHLTKEKGAGVWARGTRCSRAVMTEATVKEARDMRAAGATYIAIANHLGVSKRTAFDVTNRRTWAWCN